jgi:hypothetical protein
LAGAVRLDRNRSKDSTGRCDRRREWFVDFSTADSTGYSWMQRGSNRSRGAREWFWNSLTIVDDSSTRNLPLHQKCQI